MNKNLLIASIIIVLVGGLIFINKKPSTQKQLTNLKRTEKKLTKDLGLKESKPNIPVYKGAKVDIDKCGKDAFYIEEKSADFVKNYCLFLKSNGWRLVHQDYPDCEDIKSFGGGYNFQKGDKKIAISVIKYGQNSTCFWVYER